MIIDSHAHYNHNSFKNSFRYLTRGEGGYAVAEGDREAVLRELVERNVLYSIEPAVLRGGFGAGGGVSGTDFSGGWRSSHPVDF